MKCVPNQSSNNLTQHLFNNSVAGIDRLGQFRRFGSAAFGHVGFTATASANNRGDLADDVTCLYSGGQVVRYADNDADLAVVPTSQNDNAAL
jgi:hypothetical protein